MKKKLTAFALCVIFALMCVPAYAAEISGVSVQGNKITADISLDDGSKLTQDGISATLDGKELKAESLDVAQGKTDYFVMIDTSLSLSAEHFEAQKGAVKSLYNSKGKNDRLILYTFDKSSVKVLDGSENRETALKKISAIKAAGQDTAFYEALTQLVKEAGKSDADNVVPIVFTDGVETMNKGAKSGAEDAMKKSSVPVYGMYPSVEKEADSSALNSLLKLSGGSATAFTPANVTEKLKTYADKKSADKAKLVLTADGDIEANEKAVLSIDLGNGETLTKETPVEAWTAPGGETTQAQSETETQPAPETTTESNAEKDGFSLPLEIIIPVAAAVLLLIAVLIIFAKRKGKKDKPEDITEEINGINPEETETEEEAPEEETSEKEETTEEAPAEEAPEETAQEDTPAEEEAQETDTQETDGEEETAGEEEAPEELDPEAQARAEAAKKRAEERAARRAANLERAKEAAAARAAAMAQMGSENKAAAEAKANRTAAEVRQAAAEAKKAEKEAAAAAKARAKKEKEDRKKMKEEGANFQFYFVDGKKKK